MLTGELATIADALTTFSAKPAWSRSDAEVVAAVEALHALEQRVAGAKLALVGELDDRDLARDLGATSTLAWVRWRLRCVPAAAGAMVKLARALRAHASTATALMAGRVTVDQARAVVDALAALPSDVQAVRRLGELADIGIDAAGPGTDNRARLEDRANDALAPTDGGPGSGTDGTNVIAGQVEGLLLEHAQALDASALRVAGRHALSVIAPDLADAADRAGLEADERRARQRRRLDLHDDAYGGTMLRGYLDREGATILRTALDPLTRPRGVGDDRLAGQRRADGLVEICDRVMRDGALAAQGGQPVQLVVTTNYDVLSRAVGVGRTDTGERLSPATVRRLACDALVVPAVMNGDGQVLDLGRGRRLFTGAIRRALQLRDGGCAFPSCDRPARWCDAHHRVFWLDGGPTSLENGVMVCRFHHTLLHEPGGWQVRLGPDSLPEFVPPPWIDPDRRPLRNARHALSRPP